MGWQYQPGRPTVQETVTSACRQLFGFDCDVTGCSRTDSGVHAIGFAATVTKKGTSSLETGIPVYRIPGALNFYLPEQVAATSASFVDEDFHPRYSAHSKTYKYLISLSGNRSPLLRGRVFIPRTDLSPDAVDRMNEAAKKLIGEKDFGTYMSAGSSITDTVRTVYDCNVSASDGILTISITGNGFLYNMVRIIAGTLLDVGYKKLEPSDIPDITLSCDRKKAGPTLPPYALYLYSVDYSVPEN